MNSTSFIIEQPSGISALHSSNIFQSSSMKFISLESYPQTCFLPKNGRHWSWTTWVRVRGHHSLDVELRFNPLGSVSLAVKWVLKQHLIYTTEPGGGLNIITQVLWLEYWPTQSKNLVYAKYSSNSNSITSCSCRYRSTSISRKSTPWKNWAWGIKEERWGHSLTFYKFICYVVLSL